MFEQLTHNNYTVYHIRDDNFVASGNIPEHIENAIHREYYIRPEMLLLCYAVIYEYEKRNFNIGLNLIYAISYYCGYGQNIKLFLNHKICSDIFKNSEISIREYLLHALKFAFPDKYEYYFSLFEKELQKAKLLA